MSYFLGIDLGTTYTAAAVCRDGWAGIARLGSRTPSIPSVVLLRADGTVLTGEAAERRAVTEPERIAREFKRRFGDPTPVIVGGAPWSADALTAKLLGAVVEQVSAIEQERPEGVVVAHPANWGPYKKDLLTQAVRQADLDGVTLITEPEAAAIHYASQERIKRGAIVAVYDLGGGTFDAAVLKRTDFGWQILGQPEGVEHLGGVDFDEAVFNHVADSIGDDFDLLDPDDPAVLSAVARLRQECVEGKEALAQDTDVSIPVLLPSTSTELQVRLTRRELEEMIRPSIADSISALERALRAAGVTAEQVDSVLLVGGSSRIPLVAEMVGSMLGRPVAVDAHPKHGVALGASIVADERGALAALTAAGEAATAAARSVAALASVRGATGQGTAIAMGLGGGLLGGAAAAAAAGAAATGRPDGTALLDDGTADTAAAAGTGNGGTATAEPVDPTIADHASSPGGGTTTVDFPRTGAGTGAGTVVIGHVGAPAGPGLDDRATPHELPNVTPDGVPAYPPGAGYAGYGGYFGPPSGRHPRTGSGTYAARKRSQQVRGGMVLGTLCALIVALSVATVFLYRSKDKPNVFDPPVATTAPSGEVTTTTTPTDDGEGDGERGQPATPGRQTTTSGPTSTTTPRQTTTAPPRTTVATTAPATTEPPTTTPPTTEPPTTEPPTTSEPPTTADTTVPPADG